MSAPECSAVATRAPVVGGPAPEFELPDAEGGLHASGDYRGSPLVLVFTRHVH